MSSSRAFRLLPVLLVIVVTVAACGGSGSKTPGFGIVDWPAGTAGDVGPEPGKLAPNFRLETPSGGEPLELASTVSAGQPVLLNFWASWCTNCVEEMAALDAANGRGMTVLGVNLREGEEAVNRVAAEAGAGFPLALDRKGEVTRAYRVTNLPVTVLIDGEGIVREIVRGPIDEERIAELIASLEGSRAAGPNGARPGGRSAPRC
jgi:peroxiredoxin